jgi:hypothetical protein
MGRLWIAAGLVSLGMAQTALAGPADWTLAPYQAYPGNAQLDLGGEAGGVLLANNQPAQPGVTGFARLTPRLHRDYDTGLVLSLTGSFLASDALSKGRYGDVLEKLYGEARTGLGRLELGQTDGAAYDLAVTGPKIDAAVSLDNPQSFLFADPARGRPVAEIFALRTEVGVSANSAKIAYVSPALFGAQLALSFAPGQGKEILPFLHAGPQVAGRQADIWEIGLRYSDDVGPVTLTGYAGAAEGRAEHKLPGQEGVSDLGAGLKADYPLNDNVTLSAGLSFRQSNAHAFDVTQSWQPGTTRALHASAAVTDGAFSLGVEYGDGDADKVANLPHLAMVGYQAGAAYALSGSVQISAGWQHWAYARSSGTFFNAAPHLSLEGGFLHLNLKTSS